jgi:hypothetical protein
LLERGHEVFEKGSERGEGEEERVAALERLVGQMTVQLEAGKEVSSWLKSQ